MKITTRVFGPHMAPWLRIGSLVVARRLAWSIPLLLAALALAHGLLYAILLPSWQTPDEPTQFEYAALVAQLGRVPVRLDRDQALESRIADSLVRQRFFEYLLGHPAPTPPRNLDDIRASFFMPRQVGSDPPLYFILAALPLRLLSGRPIEQQLLGLRLLGVLLMIGTVLCAYGAGRELIPRARGFAIAAALILALQPMFVFVGAGAGNDSLANLIGAAICWVVIRLARHGVSLRRTAVLLALLALGLLTKRTLLPETLALSLFGFLWATARLARLPYRLSARLAAGALALLSLGAGAWAAVTSSRAESLAIDWVVPASGAASPRVLQAPSSGRAALELLPGDRVLQELPDVAAEWTQNQPLHFRAHVWTAGETARGFIAIDFGWARTEIPFDTNEHGREVEVTTFVPLYCPYLHLELRSEQGTIYADRLFAESERRRGLNVVSNADLTQAAFGQDSALARLRRYLRWRELVWVWHSGRLREPPPLGWELPRIFFVSFWGQFGWMSLPMVGGTPWERALALVCLGGLLGTLSLLASGRRPAWQRRAVGVLLLMIVVEILFPLLYAYTLPRSQTIQQGRYLFPALAPIALLLVLGWGAFIPARWRKGALIVGIAFGALFALAALQLIARYYHGA